MKAIMDTLLQTIIDDLFKIQSCTDKEIKKSLIESLRNKLEYAKGEFKSIVKTAEFCLARHEENL